jgi:hypothetical protein
MARTELLGRATLVTFLTKLSWRARVVVQHMAALVEAVLAAATPVTLVVTVGRGLAEPIDWITDQSSLLADYCRCISDTTQQP